MKALEPTNYIKKQVAVIYRFKNDYKINIFHPATKKDAEAMAIQLKSNPEIEYVNISDDYTL